MHEPVMLDRCVELLSPAITAAAAAGRQPVIVDATLGLGGHTESMLLAHGDLTAVGIDTDPSALKRAAARLQPLGDRNRCVHTTFDQFDEALDSLGLEQEARCVEKAVAQAIDDGCLTADLAPQGTALDTQAMAKAVLQRLETECEAVVMRD